MIGNVSISYVDVRLTILLLWKNLYHNSGLTCSLSDSIHVPFTTERNIGQRQMWWAQTFDPCLPLDINWLLGHVGISLAPLCWICQHSISVTWWGTGRYDLRKTGIVCLVSGCHNNWNKQTKKSLYCTLPEYLLFPLNNSRFQHFKSNLRQWTLRLCRNDYPMDMIISLR